MPVALWLAILAYIVSSRSVRHLSQNKINLDDYRGVMAEIAFCLPRVCVCVCVCVCVHLHTPVHLHMHEHAQIHSKFHKET